MKRWPSISKLVLIFETLAIFDFGKMSQYSLAASSACDSYQRNVETSLVMFTFISSAGRPANRVEKELREVAALKLFAFMSELEVHVPRLVVRVRPDDGVIAHLDRARRLVAVFVDVREHVDIRP